MTPATDVKSSGAEEPAAMKVAPATSSDKSSFSDMASRDGTKKSSQTIAIAEKCNSFLYFNLVRWVNYLHGPE